jgi:hypothetical protein
MFVIIAVVVPGVKVALAAAGGVRLAQEGRICRYFVKNQVLRYNPGIVAS